MTNSINISPHLLLTSGHCILYSGSLYKHLCQISPFLQHLDMQNFPVTSVFLCWSYMPVKILLQLLNLTLNQVIKLLTSHFNLQMKKVQCASVERQKIFPL